MSDNRRFAVHDFASNADRFDAYENLCDQLESELAETKRKLEYSEYHHKQTQECLLYERNRLMETMGKLEAAEKRIKESQEQEPIGYVDSNQFERWDVLRGTKFESPERCYLPFSRIPFESELSTCDLPLYAIPPIPNTEKDKSNV